MRLWHKDLLSCLPTQQLVSQWRECCAIAMKLNSEDHSPNHILVNRILDYDPKHFYEYTNIVIEQFSLRGYNLADKALVDFQKNYTGWVNWLKTELPWRVGDVMVPREDVYANWMDKRYLRQCYYNLEEKYDCGGIPEKEWDKVISTYVILGGAMK